MTVLLAAAQSGEVGIGGAILGVAGIAGFCFFMWLFMR